MRDRLRPNGVEALILDTADSDGDMRIVIPEDPGGAGKSYTASLRKAIAERGHYATKRRPHKDKVTRFASFSTIAESGFVKIVRGDWNDKYFEELEAFIGDGKTKDDQVDATSDGFNTLAEQRVIGEFTMFSLNQSNPFK